tara:strand:+ start:497 stop:1282 length:786 start_codon:yes stop_codon:yes gene_type:complete
MNKNKLVHISIISIFVSLYFLVATISMINSVAFFDLAHEGLMNWALAIGFELGAAASLAAIVILDKTNKTMVWGLFLLLTSFQMMANSFHAFINLENYMGWIELFGLEEAEPIYQKRVLSIVSGAILPLVALGFIKSLVDYIRPDKLEELTLVDGRTPYTFETDQEIIPAVGEELPEEDSYSRDADKATTPIVVGEVHIAPEVVNTNNAVADDVAKPITVEHITPVVDPPILTTPDVQISNRPKKDPLVSRPFIRGVESKP